ncbi:MAG: chemotaxis protein CheB [Ignavibacteria bacterium]
MNSTEIIKILVVEDNVSNRLLLIKVLKQEGYHVSHAYNGEEAIELIRRERFDAVITDWMMPKLDGIELIKQIRRTVKPLPLIMVITALDSKEAKKKAIEAGADDYLTKPYHIDEVKDRLAHVLMRPPANQNYNSLKIRPDKILSPDFIGVVIAASTGGPSTLIEVFAKMKATNVASIFIVLHGPAWMLKSFPERIYEEIKMPVHLGEEGLPIKRGEIYLAPGDRHMLINSQKLEIELSDSPPENFVKPAADPLFRSAAKTFGSNLIGVVLTGMGHDGCTGAGYISAAGGIVIAQDPATAIAPSMPQSVVNFNLAKYVVPLSAVAETIEQNIKKLRS